MTLLDDLLVRMRATPELRDIQVLEGDLLNDYDLVIADVLDYVAGKI